MGRQGLGSLAVAFGLMAMASPAPADAATPVGELFPADNLCGPMVPGPPSPTFLQTTSPGNRYAAPSAGVITSWRHQAGSSPPELRLKVARPTGGNRYTITGQSSFEDPDPNVVNTFGGVRIPVRAGDVIGFAVRVSGSCGRASATGYGTSNNGSDVPPGTNAEFTPVPMFQLSVSATLEPDCDGDGLGDETQDPDISSCSPPPPMPCDDFSLGKVKKNKKKGTAKLTVNVPCAGELALAKTKKVKPDEEIAEGEGEERLTIKPKGKAKRRLRKKGKAKVTAEVTYTPTGGQPSTQGEEAEAQEAPLSSRASSASGVQLTGARRTVRPARPRAKRERWPRSKSGTLERARTAGLKPGNWIRQELRGLSRK